MKKKENLKIKVIRGISGALLFCTLLTQTNGCEPEPAVITETELSYVDKYDDKFGILVNKNNKITEQEIKKIDLAETIDVNGNTIYLQKDALKAFNEMQKALEKENCVIKINTGFRSYEDQKAIYNELVASQGKKYAEKYTAKVGHSEHHTGLAIDVYIERGTIFNKQIPLQINPKYQKNKNELYDIMADYGFILRYPAGKEDITGYPEEAWHIRYVGVELAKFITEKNLTLEEYYEIINAYHASNEEELSMN